MASLLAPAPPGQARMSQVLPTVKCSDCAQPVPLDMLGEHKCAPVPAPAPKASAQPAPALPRPTRAQNPEDLLPARLKNLVAQPARTPAPAPAPAPAPTPASRAQPRPSLDMRSLQPPRAPESARERSPSVPAPRTQPPAPAPARPAPTLSPLSPSPLSPSPVDPRLVFDEPEVETRSGGEAGMAGVGRRGFAAAARAAMAMNSMRSPIADSRRPPALDTRSAARTPPLSPNDGSQSSYSPTSPHSPDDFVAPAQQPRKAAVVPTSTPFIPRGRDDHSPVAPSPIDPSPSTPRMAFFDKFKAATRAPEPASPPARSRTPSPEPPARSRILSADGSERGLAYARSSDRSSEESERRPAAGTVRSLSSASKYSTKTAAAAAPAPRLEPLDEDAPTPLRKAVSAADRSERRPGGLKAPARGSTRSTSPRSEPDRERRPSAARAPKSCVRCEQAIPDGRWIKTDGPGVLCERCWKSMYLPKCRRCERTIETAAVSSADGQLRGKWHRACFNCHTCSAPFPDKSFYVYDGKPYCAYHYHEKNDSLCAAATCGRPIEGPCAVSHAGDRYHPEHLTCEYEYPGGGDGVRARRCDDVLTDYYEFDGRMVCERHARVLERGEEDAGPGGGRSKRAMKRQTRLINLAGLPPR